MFGDEILRSIYLKKNPQKLSKNHHGSPAIHLSHKAVDIRDVPESVAEFQLSAPAQLNLGGNVEIPQPSWRITWM